LQFRKFCCILQHLQIICVVLFVFTTLVSFMSVVEFLSSLKSSIKRANLGGRDSFK
ncbi:unnamed protein product, partial [Bubo scandiacus]